MRILFISIFLSLSLFAQSLTFGIIPRYSKTQIRYQWVPLLEKITEKTGIKFKVRTESSVKKFLEAYLEGKYDLVYSNPSHFIKAKKANNYEAIVRENNWLRGIILTKKENNINDIMELKGKSFALPATAFAATLMTRVGIYEEYGFDILKEKPVKVKILQDAMLSVKLNRAIAAGSALDVFNKADPKFRKSLNMIYISKKQPTHPISIHPRISKKVKEKIRNAFLSLTKEDLNGLALDSIIKTDNDTYIGIEEVMDKYKKMDEKK